MNYRHNYHAGNCADVVKHVLLTILLKSLQKKEKGFCYIDSHSGSGLYDLQSEQANKTGEYLWGIKPIYALENAPLLQPYLSSIRSLNNNGELQLYPGSPWIASQFLRDQDRAILNELHPEAFAALKKTMRNQKNIAIHHRDAYELLPAIVPPDPPRGLVLIDPPFEQTNEHEMIASTLKKCHKRWPHGITMIWLPLKNQSLAKFYHSLKSISSERKFILEVTWEPVNNPETALRGSSFVFINLPWQAEEDIENALKLLMRCWQNIEAKFTIQRQR